MQNPTNVSALCRINGYVNVHVCVNGLASRSDVNSSTVQLLHKLSVRASSGPEKLLNVIKNPVTNHLPVGCKKIGTYASGVSHGSLDWLPFLRELTWH